MVYLHLDHEVEKIFIKQMSSILLSFDSTLEVIEFNDVKQATLITKYIINFLNIQLLDLLLHLE